MRLETVSPKLTALTGYSLAVWLSFSLPEPPSSAGLAILDEEEERKEGRVRRRRDAQDGDDLRDNRERGREGPPGAPTILAEIERAQNARVWPLFSC